ncbi:helix-turn-helix transcriptional regulator [Methanolacinia paynteri]|uniref:helix-turn-helix transcriptional regulator n=1 Tax=Methanolacinia paynteri TaxID=230356 RepID=UPI00064FF1D1|nr:helix-turn-helix transcriptional regulator [Methanolacinia paynteri]
MDNRIKELRNERGVTQQELAEKVDVSSRTIISLEKGQYNPSVLLAHKLAEFFNCAIEEVFIFDKEDGIRDDADNPEQ